MARRRSPGSRTKRPASGCASEPVSCRRIPLPGTSRRSREGRGITGAYGGSWRKVGRIYERVHMYAHVGTRTTPLCLARGDCSIVTRRDRFHLWSRMVMTPRRRRRREWQAPIGLRALGCKWVNRAVRRPRQDEESRIGDTHINLHIFGPHPSTPGPRGNPRAPGQPVRRQVVRRMTSTFNGFFCRSGIRDFAPGIPADSGL